MNERLKQLAEQAGLQPYYKDQERQIERFAELIRQDEREACAKLCDDEADQSISYPEAEGMYWCAEAIRARGEQA